MKYKSRLLSLSLCIVILITCVCSCASSADRPTMWKVTDQNGNIMYLFGSIHIGFDGMYPLEKRITDAYDECEYLAVEYDIVKQEKDAEKWSDAEKSMYLAQFLYTDGTTVKDHLSEDTYTLAKQYLQEKGIYNESMDNLSAAYWSNIISSLLIEETRFSTDYGIDRHFLNSAHASGKKVLEVESEEFQRELLLSFSDEYYESSISQLFMQKQNLQTSYGYLIDVWQRGRDDILGFMSYDAEGMFSGIEQDGSESDIISKQMLDERNINMAKVADEYIKDGKKVFFVVGAAHMCGDTGIPSLLKDMGYTVEKV